MTPLSLALAIVVAAPKVEARKEAPSIVGKWEITRIVLLGGKPRDVSDGSSYEFTADGKVIVREAGKRPPTADHYTMDPKAVPSEITLSHPEAKDLPLVLGIYKIEADILTWAFSLSGTRPKAFESPVDSDVILMTFKRMTKD